jgi:hypothetical protein
VKDLDAFAMEFMDCSNQNTEQRCLGAPTNLTETPAMSQALVIKDENDPPGSLGPKGHDQMCSDYFEGAISMLFLLNAAWLAQKQQIPMLWSLVYKQ